MMGRQIGEAQLFYIFSVDRHVPTDHLLRRVDAVLDLSFIRTSLAEHYSCTGRPSIDPELMIRMLLVGYLYGIRSRRGCAKRSTSTSPTADSAARAGWRRARTLDLLQEPPRPFPRGRSVPPAVRRGRQLLCGGRPGRWHGCGGGRKRRRGRCQSRAPPARRSPARGMVNQEPGAARPGVLGRAGCYFPTGSRRAQAGCAEDSETDPQAAWSTKTGAGRFRYETNYLGDTAHAVILDVEATPARLSQEIVAAKRMLERTRDRLGLKPQHLAADGSYGTGPFLLADGAGCRADRPVARAQASDQKAS